MAEAFTGFPPSGIAFLAGLSADNTGAYFDGNRGTYADDVAELFRYVPALEQGPPRERQRRGHAARRGRRRAAAHALLDPDLDVHAALNTLRALPAPRPSRAETGSSCRDELEDLAGP
jgi:hypothetical protein